jgi:hypothetical protein
MAQSNSGISQHKQLAMGKGFARGGAVAMTSPAAPPMGIHRQAGLPMSPLTKAKMNNGVPGFKKGGSSKKGC